MSVLGQLFDRVIEASLGRIHWYPNMWALVGSRWDKNRIVNPNLAGTKHTNEKGELERDGKVLVYRRSVWNCPNPPGDDFFVSESRAYVPATECRKCPYHRKAQGKIRFPRCTFKANEDVRQAIKDGLESANSLLDEAVKKAKEITG